MTYLTQYITKMDEKKAKMFYTWSSTTKLACHKSTQIEMSQIEQKIGRKKEKEETLPQGSKEEAH